MLTDFILALALICPSCNTVQVEEVLTVKPVTQDQCLALAQDSAQRGRLGSQALEDTDCYRELICVRVRWED